MHSVPQIVAALNLFTPQSEEGADVVRLAEIVDGLSGLPGCLLAIQPIFALLERCGAADLGSPGPVVHELEAIPGYAEELRTSLLRVPTPLTLWMVNRILNSRISAQDRLAWLLALRVAADHPRASNASKQEALAFLNRQSSA